MDHRRHGAGSFHDIAGPRPVLRRLGTRMKRAQRLHAVLFYRLPDELALAGRGLFHRLWRRQRLLGRA